MLMKMSTMRHFLGISATLGLMACTGTIDMGGDDDGPPPDHIVVRVKDGSVPVTDAKVIYQNPDDSVFAEVTTDAAGEANQIMSIANVTVIRTFPAPLTPDEQQRPPELYTYVGAKAGDILELGDATAPDAAPASAINVKVPDTAVGTVDVMTSCGTGSGTGPLIPITVRGCEANIVVYVTDQDNSSFVMSTPYAPTVDVSAGQFVGSLGTQLSAVNVAMGANVRIEKRLMMGNYTLYSTGNKDVTTTPADVEVPNLTGVDQLQIVQLTDATGRTQMQSTRQPYTNALTAVDATVMGLIPYVSNVDYSPTGISWVEAGPAAGAADSVITTLTVSRDLGGAPPGPNDVYVHAIIAPKSGMIMRMPILPVSAQNFNLGVTDNVQGRFGLVQSTAGYDSIRGRAFASSNIVDAAPASSQVVLSYAGGSPPQL